MRTGIKIPFLESYEGDSPPFLYHVGGQIVSQNISHIRDIEVLHHGRYIMVVIVFLIL